MPNLFGFLITIFMFKLFEYLKKYPILKKIPPILSAGFVIILILENFNISFETYNESASFLTFLLIPATISLAIPLFKNREILTKNKRIIYSALFFSSAFSVLGVYLVSKLFKIDFVILTSLIPKSTTSPIAVEISRIIQGSPSLTACIVVITGVFGAVFGHKLLKLFKVNNDIAIGLSIGSTTHVMGTSACGEKGSEKQVAVSTLALILTGIITAIIAPLFVSFIK